MMYFGGIMSVSAPAARDIGKAPTLKEWTDGHLERRTDVSKGMKAMEKVTSGFGAFAFPGSSDSRIIELEAGEYLAVCFIPVGLTPEVAEAAESGGEEPQGPPHFTQGMRAEFTVE